jgi:type VI secretion system protein ImpB
MPGSESLAKKITRVRPPRVHITYDVEIGDAIEKREIPFVVGVMADLSGKPEEPLPLLKNRKFVNINKDNFDEVLGKISPRLAFKVENRLSEDDSLGAVELRFHSMADFEPAAVAQQIPALRKLLEVRNALTNLRSRMIGNDKLESILQEIIQNQTALERVRAEAGTATGDQSATDGPSGEANHGN